MPARRKSAEELALSGAARKNPKRYKARAGTHVVEPIGFAPKRLSPEQRAIWREIVRLAPPGALASSDRIAVELAVRLIERTRTTEGQKPSFIAVLMSLLGKLAMTPADRARFAPSPVAPAQKDDPWASFDEPKARGN